MDRTDSLPAADAPSSFEDAQAELDELVRRMETGQMPLDGLLSAYKRGAQLLEFCRSRLDAVEEQVKVLEEGQLKALDSTMKIEDFSHWVRERQDEVERALERWVPDDSPAGLGAVMRYAVLDGGKRLRPLLVLAAAEAVSGSSERALRTAVAVELIHAYSLVHDDMPCMDNDVLRRGKPTVHVKYGEAQAMLAGDAMQALAFDVLTPDSGLSPALMSTLVRLLARASGHDGMAGGQAIDLASVGRSLDERTLRDMHRRKTGVLLQASVMMGAACGPADAKALAALSDYGAAVGLAFQVVDDVLDVTQESHVLGKTAGKDVHQNKPTFVSLLGLEAAQKYALDLRDQAHAALARSGLKQAACLACLADKIVERDN